MEYQKIANLLNDESNQPSKFRTRNWVEKDDDVRGEYSPKKLIRFKTYILVKGNITVNRTAVAGADASNTNKK